MTISRRHFAVAFGTAAVPGMAHDDDGDPALDRTAAIHGRTNPIAVAGYRLGEWALRQLKLTRGHGSLEVVHYAPATIQLSCVIDGLQASTGTSAGNLSLRLVTAESTYSVIRNRKTGQEVKLELLPEFLKQNLNTPVRNLLSVAERVSRMPEAQIFRTKA